MTHISYRGSPTEYGYHTLCGLTHDFMGIGINNRNFQDIKKLVTCEACLLLLFQLDAQDAHG